MTLVAILDWAAHEVPAFRVSNSMEADCCVEALNEPRADPGGPEIFNTDQGSQFTSQPIAGLGEVHEARISVKEYGGTLFRLFFNKWPWRAVIYECFHLHAFKGSADLRQGLKNWFRSYNQ